MDRTTDQPGAGYAVADADTKRVETTYLEAARALIQDAAYGSLALWGGRVAHGLRFTTTGPIGRLRPAVPNPPPAHPDAATSTDPFGARDTFGQRDTFGPHGLFGEQSPSGVRGSGQRGGFAESGDGTPAAGRLVLLAPISVGRIAGDDDQPCRFQMCGPVMSRCGDWASVAFGGWVAPVLELSLPDLVSRFAERHSTSDLFDLGDTWALLDIEIAEVTIRTRDGCVQVDTEGAVSLLDDPCGTSSTDGPRQPGRR